MNIMQLAARWLAVLVLLFGSLPIMGAHAAEPSDDYLPGEVLVKLQSTADLAAIRSIFKLTLIDQFGTRPIYRLRIDDGSAPPDKANALAADSRVIYAEPNYAGETPEGRRRSRWSIGGDAGEFANQWAPDALNLDGAHARTKGAGMRIAVLDTGVDASHPELAGKVSGGYDFVDFDSNPREEGSTINAGYGHGTHVAGLMALTAPAANIMPVRVLDKEGMGNLWVLAEALVYAVDPNGDGNPVDGADVINLSLGTTRPTELLSEIVAEVTCANTDGGGGDDDDDDDENGRNDQDDNQDGTDQNFSVNNDDDLCDLTGGVVVVIAAGNSGDSTPFYPGAEAVPGSLTLAASTESNHLADFSTTGSWVRLAAPGDKIISSVPEGKYGVWSGTSMAAPFAAGVAALVRAQHSTFSAQQTVERLVQTGSALCATTMRELDAATALGAVISVTDPCTLQPPVAGGPGCRTNQPQAASAAAQQAAVTARCKVHMSLVRG